MSSLLEDDRDSAECHWPDETPLCVLSALPVAARGLLFRLSRLMLTPVWRRWGKSVVSLQVVQDTSSGEFHLLLLLPKKMK